MANKDLAYYMSLYYTVELTETGWFVKIPALEGCMSQGDTRIEALEMIDEAKELWLETALEEGIAIPEPKPLRLFQE
jgi:antitoxin HicB